jgi:hypothetical protein
VNSSSPRTSDHRVTYAREWLTGSRRRKVAELPPSILMRELAEARRQLGQVLDVVRETVSLTDDQLVTVAQAVGDALSWRAPDTRRDCVRGVLCDDHASA